jgi:CheY-like chemotaxis protein
MNLPPYNDLVLRVRLFHTRASEAAPTVAALHAAGCQVDYEDESVTVALRACRASPPDVVVIDLSRLPSHGKEIAIALRQSPATRHLPIVFCGGAADKVAGIRELLPDASFCDLAKLAACARKAASAPPRKAVVPPAMMDRYASRTAAQKLGVKPDSTVGLIGAPRDYKQILGPLPPGILFSEDDLEGAPVILCFIQDADSLRQVMSQARSHARHAKFWLLWRKKSHRSHDGVTEPLVRETGIALGLVDYKICSVNPTWSAMLFALKR